MGPAARRRAAPIRPRRFTHAPHCGEAGVWLCDRAVCSPSVADAPTALAAASRPPGTEAPPPNRCASSAISLSIRSCDGRGVRVGVWVRVRVVAVAARGRGRLGCMGYGGLAWSGASSSLRGIRLNSYTKYM